MAALCMLFLLLASSGAEILSNLTVKPVLRWPCGEPPDSFDGKVLLFLLRDLQHLWVLRKNRMLRSCDILMHIAINEDVDSGKLKAINTHVKMSAEFFPNKFVRAYFVRNTGYQNRAIEAILKATIGNPC